MLWTFGVGPSRMGTGLEAKLRWLPRAGARSRRRQAAPTSQKGSRYVAITCVIIPMFSGCWDLVPDHHMPHGPSGTWNCRDSGEAT